MEQKLQWARDMGQLGPQGNRARNRQWDYFNTIEQEPSVPKRRQRIGVCLPA